MKAVVAEGLTKIYPNHKAAVAQVSFTIGKGEVFGFLGPNGAGKTTTVKLLNGMTAATQGSCRVFDNNPCTAPTKTHQIAGVVTEHAQMYDTLSGLQNLIFYGTLFGNNKTDSHKRALQLLEKLELTAAQDQKLSTYSTGMRQRLSLARALMHSPQILFLDEPTSGLDPESVLNVNQMIKSLAADEGLTIFLCTHQLRYAQEICSSYGLIDNGKILAVGNLPQLRAMVFSGLLVSMKTDHMINNLSSVKTADRCYEFSVQSEAEIPQIIKQIVAAGGNIYNVSARQMSLEEIYFELIKKRTQREELSNAK
jgi:ABC-2 type transport system ATP-binding protein